MEESNSVPARLLARAHEWWVMVTGGKMPMPDHVDDRVAALDGRDPFTGTMSPPPDLVAVRRSLGALVVVFGIAAMAQHARAQELFSPTDTASPSWRWVCVPMPGDWTCTEENGGARCIPVPDGWSCAREIGEGTTLPIGGARACYEEADGTLFCLEPLPFFYGFMVARAANGSWVAIPVPDGWLPEGWLPEADDFVPIHAMSDGSRLFVKEDAFLFWWGP